MSKPTVLIVEDVGSLAETYRSYLDRDGYAVQVASTGREAITLFERHLPHVVVLDLHLPDMDGFEILRRLVTGEISTEVVVMTSQGSVQSAVQAMRDGAFDFIMKPFNAERLKVTVRNAVEKQKLANTIREIREEFDRDRFVGFIGRSLAMQTVYRILQSAAPSNASVFITGESGTGKELCADALHKLGKRSKGPFVAVNCAAIPRDMLESELFGHVKGAFTGAANDRKGAAQSADSGTLFLDEICEMDLALQAKMLRFLQTRMVQRLGDDALRPVDVRLVCATNRDPQAEVAAGRFREDLFYRLHVVPLELPPLRDREDDVILIARHFLKQYSAEDGKSFSSFSSEAEQALLACRWPGNVRQVQNAVRNTVVLHDGAVVEAAMLPRDVLSQPPAAPEAKPAAAATAASVAEPRADPGAPSPDARRQPAPIRPLELAIRELIEAAVEQCGGSIPRAAAALDIAPSTIYRRIQQWNEADGGDGVSA